MKNLIYYSALCCCMAIGFSSFGQDEEDMDYRNRHRDEEAINTNKATPIKAIEAIVGTWQMEGALKGGKNVAGTDTVAHPQTITFGRENKYVSHFSAERIDSGTFRMNENHSSLYMESEGGGEPTEWEIWIEGEQLMMQQRQRTSATKPVKLVYNRKEGN